MVFDVPFNNDNNCEIIQAHLCDHFINRFNPGNTNFLIVKIILIRRTLCDPTVAGSSRTQVGL